MYQINPLSVAVLSAERLYGGDTQREFCVSAFISLPLYILGRMNCCERKTWWADGLA